MDTNKKLEMEKMKWLLLLFLALLLFSIGLMTKNIIYYILTLLLTFFIRKYGYDLLFKEYDDKQKEKKKKLQQKKDVKI